MRIAIPAILALAATVVPTYAQNNAGRQTYEASCSRCHGGDATGGEAGPNITGPVAVRTDEQLTSFLREGRPASGMPAFANFAAPEMANLITYLRSMQALMRTPPPVPERRTVTTASGTLTGLVLNQGMSDMQLRGVDNRVHLLRKASGDRWREVTSQSDWLGYNGDATGNRYTKSTLINKGNVKSLAPKWIFPMPSAPQVQNTPVVVEGIMYVSNANECYALDAGNGRQIWRWQRPRTRGLSGNAALGFNRGVAVSGNRLFMLTDNAHMIALDRFTGAVLWETEMADWHQNYNGTSAPLIAGDLVVSGLAGGDEGVRGLIAAYYQSTGEKAWQVWTVPQKGEPGDETWIGSQTDHRGGATWMTGTFDAELGLLYWPTGNPGSDFYGEDRLGDNLYSDSVLAIDAKTGNVRWYYQFTPHDIHDWDAQEPPVLVDANWPDAKGKLAPRKLLVQANRNGFFYVLDRTNGEFLLGKPFLKKINWANSIGKDGKPVLNNLPELPGGEVYVCPGFQGGANWYSTSYNPGTGLYYFQALERCNIFSKRKGEWQPGKSYMGGTARPAPNEQYVKSVRALNLRTGDIAWDLPQGNAPATASAGLLSTASGLVFFGENSGSFMAADATTGAPLWSYPTNQGWRASPMTYVFDNKQFIAVAVGTSIMAFGLPGE
jgi:alcohol dehydrogenase (cytochrome c)